jgi:SAM-dependent methyltransferase
MDKYLESNRALWDLWTRFHVKSKFYDVEGFKAGRITLHPIEREALGDVSGKSLLQCHFGLDTLSWARLGARVTGVDFSEEAIGTAQALSTELGIEANFVRSNPYDLPAVLSGEFDIIFTSYGVLGWLPDLGKWGEVVGHFLKPGGTFFIVEGHPLALVFDDADGVTDLRVAYDYFQTVEPLVFPTKGSYADREADYEGVEYGWNHSLSDILNALISAGLRIEYLREYPFLAWKALPFMELDGERWWRLPRPFHQIPLMFSLKATK